MIHVAFAFRSALCTAAMFFVLLHPLGKGEAQTSGAMTPQPASPPKPIQGNISVWPTTDSIAPGTTVLIETSRLYGVPYRCKLESLDDRGITCHGPHHRSVTYERNLVHTLSMETQHLRHAFIGFAITGALLTGGGLACVFAGGGAGCAVVIAAGLVADLVAAVLRSIHDINQPGNPTPIYIAPPTAAGTGAAA